MLFSLNFYIGVLCLFLVAASLLSGSVTNVFYGIIVLLGIVLGVANIYFAWRTEA